MSPFKLSFFRWTLAFIILLPFTYSEIRKNLKYYKENFGSSNAYVDNVIIKGYNEAIYSYNGELGKL